MAGLNFTGTEVSFSVDDIIVSKTDLKGNIIYANQTFCDVSSYKEHELLGRPHSLIRHPNMPRAVFKLIWDRVQSGREIFGYVVNTTKGGDYYWVLAHVTPSFDENHKIVGYHSNRRVPDKTVISTVISPLYAELLQIERNHPNAKEGLTQSFSALMDVLQKKGIDYDEFILTLGGQGD